MSELKSRANALQGLQSEAQHDLLANIGACELACRMAVNYLQDLCVQLNVLQPSTSGVYSLAGRQDFPPLAQRDFRCDARRKMLRNGEAFDYIAMG